MFWYKVNIERDSLYFLCFVFFTEVLKIYGPPFQNIWPAVSKYMARGFIMYGPTCRNSKETHSYLPLVTNTIGDALRDITTGVTTWGLRVVIGVENGK